MREFDVVFGEVPDAVDDAPLGRIIADSEEQVRDQMDAFRRRVYEAVPQAKVDTVARRRRNANAGRPVARHARQPDQPGRAGDGVPIERQCDGLRVGRGLDRRSHARMSKETLRTLVIDEGKQVQRPQTSGALRPETMDITEEDPVALSRRYAGCDGVKLPLITDEEKRRRRQ